MNKGIITAACAAIFLTGAGTVSIPYYKGLTACAEEMVEVERHDGTDYTYDECLSIIFSKAWGTKSDDGVSFAQQSFLYHRIKNFLDRYYMTYDDYRGRWDKYADIVHKWELYNKDYWNGIRGYDDDKGHYMIVEDDDERNVVYTFELVDGMWVQLDTSGNMVDNFEPHPFGKTKNASDKTDSEVYTEDGEDTFEGDNYYEPSNYTGDEGHTVTGLIDDELEKPAERKAQSSSQERVFSEITVSEEDSMEQAEEAIVPVASEEKEKNVPVKYIAIGAGAVVVFSAVGAILSVKKKRK